MLILTRRIGETVIIGTRQYTVTVLGVNGNQVRLGFVAPADTPIHRQEIYERISRENGGRVGVGERRNAG